MYCSSCGVAIAQGLSYCNHCGAHLNGVKPDGVTKGAEMFTENLMWAIVGVFAIGVGSTIGLIAVMKNYGLNEGLISAFAVSIFALMLVIEAVFIGLLLSRKSRAKAVDYIGPLKKQTTNALEEVTPRALSEPAESVTEHTTRAFEPIYRERKPD